MFTIDAKLYVAGAEDARDYHTFTQTTPLTLKIPQMYAMWAAAFGSVLGYLVALVGSGRPQASQETLSKARGTAVILRDVLSAALLGAAITIVTSRLAETQFPIKVSVSDIWGAITVGFVAYFTGQKLIDSLRKSSGSTSPKT